MTLTERLLELVRACFTGIWIETHEQDDALAEVARLCQREQWRLATWDISQGLNLGGAAADENGGTDPLAALRALDALASDESPALLVLNNFHRFLNSAEIVQALARQLTAGKQNRTFVVILAPVVQIPVELEKQMLVVEHDLPSRDQLAEIARGIATEENELPNGDTFETVMDAAAGLTRYEAESAFSLSLVRSGRVEPEAIWELKTQTLHKSGLLTLHRGQERFDDLGGLEALKQFCLKALNSPARHSKRAMPRGVLLLGVPGSGKSAFCKALGNETGRPTLILDIGALMGSLVGQTEANIRRALKIADAMQPAVIMLDEVEKALSGVSASGQTDSGVSARLFGTLLTWLSDHQSDLFVVCTANDASKLPPEFSRAERFDGVFFLDLPGTKQKQGIWRQYLEHFELDADQELPSDDDWTGAEIRSCCRLAALLEEPVKDAAQNIVPVAQTAHETVTSLKCWASSRCLSAEDGGIYRPSTNGRSSRRRRVTPGDASLN